MERRSIQPGFPFNGAEPEPSALLAEAGQAPVTLADSSPYFLMESGTLSTQPAAQQDVIKFLGGLDDFWRVQVSFGLG